MCVHVSVCVCTHTCVRRCVHVCVSDHVGESQGKGEGKRNTKQFVTSNNSQSFAITSNVVSIKHDPPALILI